MGPRDRSGAGIHITSNLLPTYLGKKRSVEELLPWLYYLTGMSAGDFQEALTGPLGKHAKGLSARRWARPSGSG